MLQNQSIFSPSTMAEHDNQKFSRQTSLTLVFVAYLVAIGLALGVGYAVNDHFNSNAPLFQGIIGNAVGVLVIWTSSLLVGNSSMYDAYWSVAPQVVAIYWAIAASIDNRDVNPTRTAFILISVNLWSLRLTINWIRGFPGLHHEDFRYVNMKNDMLGGSDSFARKAYYWVCGSLLGLHLFPTVETFLGSTPMYFGLYRGNADLQASDYIGFVVALLATLLELVADEQMKSFKRQCSDSKATCDQGLWRYSRHPNYLGEVLLWWGLFLLGINSVNGQRYWWTIAGTVMISLMIYFISIPMMEQRQLKRRKEAYERYIHNVPSRLFLWFRRSNQAENQPMLTKRPTAASISNTMPQRDWSASTPTAV
eukprot:TRINITY_DN11946_c0_g1_i17.p2 TRINITY_DN11946_c0_g1~~TRINITY_DN11946_c0_g1_i17.p2  ORF type:complete len:366 (+),score=46.29 TRINITY_DN11946_c0_g1_i17:2621-3718(+)